MKTLLKKLFKWILLEEIKELENNKQQLTLLKHDFYDLFTDIKVGVDYHEKSSSWAVISLQGEKLDYLKFIDLERKDIQDIQHFLRHFDKRNRTIDANPQIKGWLKTGR